MDTFEQCEATKPSVKPSSSRTSSRLRYLVPDTPDSTSVVSGWCTYDPERLSSAVYTGTENLHTSSDARSLWQHWREGKRISLSTDFGSIRLLHVCLCVLTDPNTSILMGQTDILTFLFLWGTLEKNWTVSMNSDTPQ